MHPLTRCLVPLAAAALLAVPSVASAASSGDLDPAFGTGGKTTLDLGSDELATAAALQPDGKLVVAGKGPTALPDIAVARYNPDGTLDASFDGDGVSTIPFGNVDIAQAVAIQPDGNIVVAGQTSFTNSAANPNDFAIARLTPDGAPDSTFSGDGKLQLDMGGNDVVRAIAFQGDRIVVGGESLTSSGSNFVFAGLTKSGGFDSGFSSDGVQYIDLGGTDLLKGMVRRPDGRLLAVGFSNFGAAPGNPQNFAMVQLDGTGELDRSFSGDGKQFFDFGHSEFGDAVALQSDGRAIVAGSAGNVGQDVAAIRVNPDGALDKSFGANGLRTVDFADVDAARAVAVTPQDRIVIAGTEGAVAATDFAVAVLDANGTPDSTFSGDGRQTVDFGGEDAGRAVAVAGDRAYVAGAIFGTSARDFGIAKLLLADDPPPTTGGTTEPAPGDPAPPTPTPPTPPQPDRTAPTLKGLKLTPTTFTARKGTKLVYRLSEKAKVTLTVERLRRVSGRTAFARFAKVVRASSAGTTKLRVRRRVGTKKLTPGRYRLTLVATDAAGNRSKPARAKFTVTR